MAFTAAQIAALHKGDHTDSENLILRVGANGGRSWVFRYRWGGSRLNLGLGGWPEVSAQDARRIAQDYRHRLLVLRQDPRVLHAERRRPTKPAHTLRSVALEAIDALRHGWKDGGRSGEIWTAGFEAHLFPALGDKAIESISTQDLAAVLGPLQERLPETARKLIFRTDRVFTRAVALGLREDNPAVGKVLRSILPRVKHEAEHFQAPSAEDLREAYRQLRGMTSWSSLALRWTILTVSRPTVGRSALWSEIDLEGRQWLLPAERMKVAKEHDVHLNDEMVAILNQCRNQGSNGKWVFAEGKAKNHLSDVAVTKAFHRVIPQGKPAVHGIRSTFSDWANTQGFDRLIVELALHHDPRGAVEKAYHRTTHPEKRAALLEAWKEYLAG